MRELSNSTVMIRLLPRWFTSRGGTRDLIFVLHPENAVGGRVGETAAERRPRSDLSHSSSRNWRPQMHAHEAFVCPESSARSPHQSTSIHCIPEKRKGQRLLSSIIVSQLPSRLTPRMPPRGMPSAFRPARDPMAIKPCTACPLNLIQGDSLSI